MRPRTLVVLFVLVAGLAGFIWFFERDLPSTDERAEQSKKLVRFDAESVQVIELKAGGQSVRLERTGVSVDGSDSSDEWMLEVPREARADAEEVRGFLEGVQDLKKERTLEDASRGELGLEPPRAEVKIETGSEDIVLRFGSEVPASSNTIVEVGSGPPFFVVSGGLVDDVTRDPNDWRSRDAIPFARSRIERIEVLDSSKGFVLERAESGFLLAAPIEDLADEDKVSDLLTTLVEIEIEEFVDDPGADFEATPLAVELTVTDLGEPVLVEVAPEAASEDLALLRVDGQMFKVKTDLASLLEQQPGAWRSTSWSDRDAFDIDSFRIVRAEQEIGFERRDGKWLSAGVEIEFTKVSSVLFEVTDAKGEPIDPAPGVAAGELEVELFLESESGTETLRLWADGETTVGGREGRTTLIRFTPEFGEQLFEKLEELEAVELASEKESD